MNREHVSFPGPQGVELVGRLEHPAAPDGAEPLAYALFAHCFTCTKDLKSAGLIARQLVAHNIAVLRFDFAGVGESGGDLADTTFSANVEDLVAAAAFLRRAHRPPAILLGHSLGGAAVLAAARHIPEAEAIATIAAPSSTEHLRRKLLENHRPASDSGGEMGEMGELFDLDLGGSRPVRVRRRLLDDLALDHLGSALANLHCPLLLFHSPADRVVGIEHAERLFLAARHPKSFVSLATADHLLTDPRDATQVGAVLAAWATRYVGAATATTSATATTGASTTATATATNATATATASATAAPAGSPATEAAAPPLAAKEVEVRGTAGTLRQQVRAGSHAFAADEPAADGGTDTGPTPYGLLLAALGACTSMTLLLYAQRKGVPLASTRVLLRHGRDHAADCADCPSDSTARVERIDRDIELTGPLTAEQRTRLLEIADRCPVHRTLTHSVRIVTRLQPPVDTAAASAPVEPPPAR